MKKISVIILAIVIVACASSNKNVLDGVEIVPVDVHKASKDASSFLEKIEIVPLETNDSSIFHKCNKIIYNKSMDMYALYTSDQIVFTFSGNGKYIDNSKRMNGQGPKEYNMVLDINFNPYLKGIDMLNPYGTVYTYSPTFGLLSKRQFKPEFPVDYLMALDSDNYIFNHPFVWTNQEVSFIDLKTQQSVNANYEGTISGNTMSNDCFYRIGEHFYFVPFGVNYYFYQIDAKEKKLTPIIYLDMGDAEVKADGLPGRAVGKRNSSDEEKREITKEATERYLFLKYSSQNLLPVLKFFNNDYVYVYLTTTDRGYGSHFIYNRKIKEGFLVKDGKPFIMYPCFGIVDNVLLSICQPDRISEVVVRKLMAPDEIQKMEQLTEDDNPVIVKYYLKKMIRLISLLFVTILLTSCKESRVDKITRLVNEWSGKTIRFPDNMCLTSYANDTVIMKYEREKLPYTILNYVDTIGCMSCKLQLPRWKEMLEEIDSVYPNKVNCLMVFYPKGKRKFIKHLRDNHFDRFVFIDEMDSLNRMNNFLHEEHLCTFLLDKNDKIIAIGNPILNYNVKKMYLDIISGKTVLSSYDKQLLTDVSISKTKIDLGTFSWNDAQEVEIQISNVGKNTLVMNDVITSCGCISVEYSKEPIQSNKVLSMKIKYKAEHPEHFDKTITIYCNIKDAPLRLKISGNAE